MIDSKTDRENLPIHDPYNLYCSRLVHVLQLLINPTLSLPRVLHPDPHEVKELGCLARKDQCHFTSPATCLASDPFLVSHSVVPFSRITSDPNLV